MRRIHTVACVCVVLAVALMTRPGAAAQDQKPHQEEDTSSPSLRIDWKDFRKLYDSNAVEVIDVRGDVFFESGHIPGARSIPLDQIEKRAPELRRSKKPIVLYCA